MKDLKTLFVSPTTSLHDVLICINTNKRGVALVVDSGHHLLGVITDGDVRRAILAELDLMISAQTVLDRKATITKPITASATTPRSDLIALVQKTGVSHIPLLDYNGRVVELLELSDLLSDNSLDPLPLQAVVMAGGSGTRLQPLTDSLPKPMLPVGDRPLMERIIGQLSQVGIRRVHITTHYLAEKIIDHFGDGRHFGVELEYLSEECQLGTAGGLALLATPDVPLLVINGDILTGLDFRAMFTFHKEHQADLTVAVRQYEMQVPYGVVESDGPNIRRVLEKPVQRFFVNAGIYLLEPVAHKLIPVEQHFDMTNLIQLLIDREHTVVSFPVWEYWRDIGQHSDYEQAQDDAKNGRVNS